MYKKKLSMKIIKIICSMFVLLSCNEQQIWQEIESGKTIKVFPKKFNITNSSNYIYKWSKPIGKNESKMDYNINHDKLLFTPISNGEYRITLEIENMMKEKVHEEIFFFNVINEKKNVSANKVVNDKKNKNEIIINNIYTIQVASWTSKDKAKEDMFELIELGFDTYIEEFYDSKNNIQRWRVRIGSFKNKELALKVKNKLSEFRGEDPWIAYIK
ncbi:MAG: hypothetical protein CMG49_01555 [Candidatus Marinimicrobia bacterium]|nr:hypothetical protein [Candidatus Neomarinimicrobiota bacterium]|tara:strand:+ start:64 stop:708 length:645 start_codon:yes stop_codon:yes gene_type:complete